MQLPPMQHTIAGLPVQPLVPVMGGPGDQPMMLDDGMAGPMEEEYDDDDDDEDEMMGGPGPVVATNSPGQPAPEAVNYKSKPRRKSSQRPESSDQKRQAFSKRKRGLVLKSYQLYKLTDAKVFMFVVNDKGSSWAYASPGFGQCLSPGHLKMLREYAKLPSVPKTGTEIMGHPRKDEVDKALDDRDMYINNHSIEANGSAMSVLETGLAPLIGLPRPAASGPSGAGLAGLRADGPTHSGISNGDRFMAGGPPAPSNMPPPLLPSNMPPPGMPPPGLPQMPGEGPGPSGLSLAGKRPPLKFGPLLVEEPSAEPPSVHDTIITPSGRRMAAAIGISLNGGPGGDASGMDPPAAPRGGSSHEPAVSGSGSGGSRGRTRMTDRSTSSDTRSNPPGGHAPAGSSGGPVPLGLSHTGPHSSGLAPVGPAGQMPPPSSTMTMLPPPGQAGSSSAGLMGLPPGAIPLPPNTPLGMVVQGTDGILYRIVQELSAPPMVEQPLVVNYVGPPGHGQPGTAPVLQLSSSSGGPPPPPPGWAHAQYPMPPPS